MIIINMNKAKNSKEQAKPLDISVDNIGLPSHTTKNTSPLLVHEHRFIRKQNQALKKQLQSISLRLDQQIKKRSESSKKRPWSNADDITYLELQNAYKKCQIYKKQAKFYRKRLSSFQDESKYEEYDTKMNEYMKENIELKNEIKTLRKAIKLQEKGLQEMGTQEYAKISRENEQLKEQNRRLKKYLSQYRLASLKTRQSEQRPNDKNATSENEANNDDPNSIKEKLEKSYQKNKILTNQNSHLRDLIENYKLQVQEKDRDMNLLKERIANLRKNNELLSQRSLKSKKSGNLVDDYEESKGEAKAKSRIKVMRTEPVESRVVTYPIKIEKGKGSLSSIRWSDETFTGRIKEIQVVMSKNGQIKDIHARYQKGQGKRYSQSKGKTEVFICSEDEYIYSMSGGFVDSCLRFLTLKTNSKRGQSFGTAIEESNGQFFTFQAKQGEFLGALFGQKSDLGITKLGCYIMKI